MDTLVPAVFVIVYLGMIFGRIPGLALDRTGVALLGAIVLLAFARVTVTDLPAAVDIPTISLLFGLMVLSAQFRLAGAYSYLIRRIGTIQIAPPLLLGVVIGIVALLSAVLVNDVICLAAAPVLIEACARRKLNPVPFLLALAAASNIGSAATLIGNPQNILIGQALHLSFSHYLLWSLPPVLLGLALLWLIVWRQYRTDWSAAEDLPSVETIPFSVWQSAKGTVVTIVLFLLFLVTPLPRDLVALAAAGLLLLSRKLRSREILGLIDWQLLVLFVSLFVVNFALGKSGLTALTVHYLATVGIDIGNPAWLFAGSAVLSNIVSNVPATMLLLPYANDPIAGPALALSSTLAGNLIVVGSIANIIVLEQASRLGVSISWRTHARTGVPVTLATLAVAAAWLQVIG